MSQRNQIYALSALMVLLGVVLYFSYFYSGPKTAGVPGGPAADIKFVPLDVQEPHLRIDQLQKLQKLEYSGSHRNIFVATPPPPPQSAQSQVAVRPFVGPRVPPPPPPLQIPAEFFGFSMTPVTGKRVAFFTSGEDVLVVPEGDTFLGRYRLIHMGNDSADVEEIATGRHATVPIVMPPAGQN